LYYIALAYMIFLVAPILLLLLGSFGESWTNTLFPHGATWQWYQAVYEDPSFRRAFFTSLKVVFVTCALNILIGVPFAYAVHRGAKGGIKIVAAPELVLAFGFILVFSSDTLPWLGSFWLLAAGHVVLTLPYTVTALMADMEQLHLERYETAASSLGAAFFRRLWDVTVPLLAPSLMATSLTVAALSIGEFQLSNLIAGFLSRTYPVILLQAFYGATGFACAATIILLILATIASVASSLAARLSPARSLSR